MNCPKCEEDLADNSDTEGCWWCPYCLEDVPVVESFVLVPQSGQSGLATFVFGYVLGVAVGLSVAAIYWARTS